MYRLIIAEDDDTIRRGLHLGFDWERMGYEVGGLAKDGEECLRLVRTKQPEVLLTDIRMPGLDGLDLLEKCLEIRPEMKTVILTGYARFDYAQRAVMLHAFAYVLKIEIDTQLEPAMQRLKAFLDTFQEKEGEEASEIDGVLRYIHDNYGKRILLKDVAEQCFMSQSYFCRYFRKKTGCGFNEYLRNCRLENAYRLLTLTDMRIGDIAERVGYEDSRYFSDLFFKKYNILPSELRRKQE